jgi:integrase/recombinase XerC
MKQDTVYFSDYCKKYLQEYYNSRVNITAREGHEDALFLSNRQQRISVRNVQDLVKKYASVAVPGKHITPHKLRSTYGSMLYENTSDIYLVAQSLGHNSVDTSSKYYVSTSDKKKKENRNAVDLQSDE